MEAYSLSPNSRGKAIIFSHIQFDDSVLGVRNGAYKDVENLQEQLPRIGFHQNDIIIYQDLSLSDIVLSLTRLCETSLNDIEWLMMFVLTHGYGNNEVFARNIPYHINSIMQPFFEKNCPKLCGKPKIFFIVACRVEPPNPQDKIPCQGTSVVDEKDVMIIHSSRPDSYSYRQSDLGTWFIDSFCTVLRKQPECTTIDIFDLIEAVNQTMEVKCTDEKKQNACYKSMLTKRLNLYFRSLDDEQ